MSASPPPAPVARTRRRWPLWAAVLLFLAAAISVPMASHFRKRAEPRFQQVSEAVNRIHQKMPELYIITPTPDDNPDKGGAYICEMPLSRVELQRLPRNPDYIARWQGVVYAYITPANIETNAIDWGENAMIVGNIRFFGDARLLARIQTALTTGSREASIAPSSVPQREEHSVHAATAAQKEEGSRSVTFTYDTDGKRIRMQRGENAPDDR